MGKTREESEKSYGKSGRGKERRERKKKGLWDEKCKREKRKVRRSLREGQKAGSRVKEKKKIQRIIL